MYARAVVNRQPFFSRYFDRETFGSPKFPSYPLESMPWSQTPVVTSKLATTCQGLLPSARSRASALPEFTGLSNDHNYTIFGAQYRAWILAPSSFVLRLPGLHVDFTTERMADLCSGGTFAFAITHWITLTNFIPILRGFPTFRAYLGTRSVLFAITMCCLHSAGLIISRRKACYPKSSLRR